MQDMEGLVLWPKRQVVSITPEYQRHRCVMTDGSVAHFPGPVPEGPWVALGESRVMPELLRRSEHGWLDPADFLYPPVELAAVPAPPAEVDLPGLPCKPSLILSLRGVDSEAFWHTDVGDFPAGLYASQAAALHPDMVHAGRGEYVNRRRLRRILNEHQRFRLVLDSGYEVLVSYGPHEKLCADLGLPNLYQLEPCLAALYREGMRDYPREIKNAPAAWLKAHFPTPRRLIANVLWQVFRYRQWGRPEVAEYGDDHRGFYYDPLKPPLQRAGFGACAEVRSPLEVDDRLWASPGTDDLRVNEPNYALLLDIVGQLVGADQLLTFQDIGFLDPRPDLRKKIRDDKGYWNQLEVYIRDRSEAEFTHGICPECEQILYPEFCQDPLS